MNLPNSITVARIAAMPFVAALPFVESWEARLAAFVLYILAAVTDYLPNRANVPRSVATWRTVRHARLR